ncbi:cytochrome P450 [Streptomyces sp. NPDC051582]|uniref:cytochrome P450 n=1 Tax=Streptomyces sp. NPDC051582 TaxID=3155167 RepID=UPI00341B013E
MSIHDSAALPASCPRAPAASTACRVGMRGGRWAWLVTGHEEVRRRLADPVFAVDDRFAGSGHRGFRLPGRLAGELLNRDGASHARLRAAAAKPLAPQRMRAWEEPVGRIADGLAAAVARRGCGDLVADFAVPLALTVVADLLDVPPRDRDALMHWTRLMFAPPRPEDLTAAIEGVHGLADRLVTTRTQRPGTDLVSHWAATAPGAGLDRNDVVILTFGMWWAGIENTAHLITRSALDFIHPASGACRQRPVDRALIEQLLTRQNPVLTTARRFARRDLTIAGQHIHAGDTILFSLTTAPHAPHRGPGRHLAFGHGPHHCPGAALARLELQAALTALQRRLSDCALAVPPHCVPQRTSHRLAGLLAVPITM